MSRKRALSTDQPARPELRRPLAMQSTQSATADDIYQRALVLASRRIRYSVEADVAGGVYREKALAAALEAAPAEAAADEQRRMLRALQTVHTARRARPAAVVDAAGISVDARAVQVLVQPATGTVSSTGSRSGHVRPPLRELPPNTLLSWTKYYAAPTGPGMTPAGGPGDPPKRRKISGCCGPADDPYTDHENYRFDLLSSLASCPELLLHLCAWLAPGDVLTLYRTSRVFQATINADLRRCVLFFARCFAPETMAVFPWTLYRQVQTGGPAGSARAKPHTQGDPRGIPLSFLNSSSGPETTSSCLRTPSGPETTSAQPTMRYLNMLLGRRRAVRDILACLARSGHRLPRGPGTSGHRSAPGGRGTDGSSDAAIALLKMWLIMDVSTNRGRLELVKNEQLFSDVELITILMFYVKLTMYFHDPLESGGQGAMEGVIVAAPPGPGEGDAGGGGPGFGPGLAPGAAAIATQTAARIALGDDASIADALLGHRAGLYPLWAMLRGKAYTRLSDIFELKVRYDYMPAALPPDDDVILDEITVLGDGTEPLDSTDAGHVDMTDDDDVDLGALAAVAAEGHAAPLPSDAASEKDPTAVLQKVLQTVPLWEMGTGHLEGWGLGCEHLLRPDEVALHEALRRRLDLPAQLPFFAVWGFRDLHTGANLVPSVEEMYMSDDDPDGHDDRKPPPTAGPPSVSRPRYCVSARDRLARRCGNVPSKPGEWQAWQVLRAKWKTLPLKDKLDIWWVLNQERLKTQAWVGDPLGGEPDDNDDWDVDEADMKAEAAQANATASADAGGEGRDTEAGHEGGAPDDVDDDMGLAVLTVNDGNDSIQAHWVGSHGEDNGNEDSRPSSPENTPLPVESSGFNGRHRRLISACVRRHLELHTALDALLEDQADEEYAEEDLAMWEQALDAFADTTPPLPPPPPPNIGAGVAATAAAVAAAMANDADGDADEEGDGGEDGDDNDDGDDDDDDDDDDDEDGDGDGAAANNNNNDVGDNDNGTILETNEADLGHRYITGDDSIILRVMQLREMRHALALAEQGRGGPPLSPGGLQSLRATTRTLEADLDNLLTQEVLSADIMEG